MTSSPFRLNRAWRQSNPSRSRPVNAPGPWRRTVTTLGAAALAVSLAACGSMSEREKGTAQGAAIGAVAGAVLGTATGGKAGTSAAIGGAVGAVAGNLWSKRLEDKREALAKATQGSDIDVSRTSDNRLKVNVPADGSFDVGSARLQPELKPVLEELSRNLDGQMRIVVVGHTDSTGSAAINGPLSVDRAAAVRDYLTARGVSPRTVSIEGMADRQPVASNATVQGRAQNRRVEIYLTDTSA